jgi:TonB family protein
MNITREKTIGFVGSVIFCLLIFLILYFTVLNALVKSGEEGVLVNFGTVDLSAGTFSPNKGNEPTITEPAPPKPEPQAVKPQVSQPVIQPSVPKTQPKPNTPPITQNIEQTAAIEAAKQKQQEKDRLEAEQRAAKAKAEEEQRKRDAINQQVSGAFGSGSGSSGQQNQGAGQTGSGIQGNPQSTSTTGVPTGGGYGEFNLGGRTLGAGGLPRPAYSVQEEGRIVINITVDPKGNVIFAEIGKGTNIDNGNMRNAALEAARKARFNSTSGNNNQSGTITYKYSLK